jgi:hypothetical protein
MKIPSVTEIKKELETLPKETIVKLCVRLATYKKDNKELLNYLLFEAHNEESYVNAIKEEISLAFEEMNTNSVYFAKKGIRRILRILKRSVRYSGNKKTEAELLIFFCEAMNAMELPIYESKVLINLYQRQLVNIRTALATLHEDLQADYAAKVSILESGLSRIT